MEQLDISSDSRSPETADRPAVTMCTFVRGRQRYGIPLAGLRAVLDPCRIFPLPTAPDGVLGVIHWRGEVIPVVEGDHLFGGDGAAEAAEERLLVCENGGVPVAVRIAGVPALAAIDDGEVVSGGELTLPPHVRGLCDYGEELIYLLDIEGLLAAHRP